MAWYLFDFPIYLLHLNWCWYCEWCHRVTSPLVHCQPVRWIPRFTAKSYVRRRRRVAPSKEYCWNRWLEERMLFWCFGNPLVELKYEVCGHVWHSSISPVPYFCHGFVDSASHDPHYFQLRFEFGCPAHRNLQITSYALDFWYPVSSFTHLFAGSSAPYRDSVCCWVVNGYFFRFGFGQRLGQSKHRRSSNQLGCALSGRLDSLVARWGRQGLDVKDLFRGRLPTDSNGMRDIFVGCKL